uniref:tRNA wybutosine-synthesizing protein 3 homolog n=1 Tax=Arion vulgaris TaxID=1028688 RepID=A0A0B7AZI4_9EUPU
MNFVKQKTERLQHVDLSRKGSVDEALHEVVNLINSLPMYFTTSSCSGRTILVENLEKKVQKKGCKWLYVSHDPVVETDIENALKELIGEAVLKFEPMVMHIQCQALDDAQRMHQAAVAAGFRNSGITVGLKGKIMIAVRSTHSLEAPLSDEGKILVSQEYLKYLTVSANGKMQENFARIHRFHENVKLFVKQLSISSSVEVDCRKKRKNPAKVKKAEANKDVDIPINCTDNNTFNSDGDMSLFLFDTPS